MRRLLLIPLIAAWLLVGHVPTGTVAAEEYGYATFGIGWNLVSGPEGSHLVGATGSILTWQPDDVDYERLPADAPLHGGFGYWAYFPHGGYLRASPTAPTTYTLQLARGQRAMVGNPNLESPSVVQGVQELLTWSAYGVFHHPFRCYLETGQGAFVSGEGTVVISRLVVVDRAAVQRSVQAITQTASTTATAPSDSCGG